MKTISFCAAILALTSQVSSHYIFETLTANGVKNPAYTYVRKNTNYNSPVTDLTSKDLICNVGGASGSNTSTVSMKAGASLSFTSDVAVYHQGPISVYMAKAPTTAAEFDGTGQVWFKIYDEGPKFSGGSASWNLRQTYTFNIPSCIAAGEYLVRIQSLAIHNPGSTPQFYISCAQVQVTGGGSTDLGPKVKIPGYISKTDPGYTANIYNGFTSYTIPGPAVAKC